MNDPETRDELLVIRLLKGAEDAVLVSILTAMIGLAALQIVMRNFFDAGLIWADPLLRVLVLWVGMLGALAATRDDRQITVDVISRFAPARWKPRLRVVTDLFTCAVSGILAWHAARLVLEDRAVGLDAFSSVPVWVCELVLPIALGLIAFRYACYTVIHFRHGLRAGSADG